MHLKVEVPYIHGLKDWSTSLPYLPLGCVLTIAVKRLMKLNEDTRDDDNFVFIPGYRSTHPASVAWKKWENMAYTMGEHVERAGTRRFISGNFKVYVVEYVDREQFGALKSGEWLLSIRDERLIIFQLAMRRLLMTQGMSESVNLRSEALLSYRA